MTPSWKFHYHSTVTQHRNLRGMPLDREGAVEPYHASCHPREELDFFPWGLSKLAERENQLAKEFCQRVPRGQNVTRDCDQGLDGDVSISTDAIHRDDNLWEPDRIRHSADVSAAMEEWQVRSAPLLPKRHCLLNIWKLKWFNATLERCRSFILCVCVFF